MRKAIYILLAFFYMQAGVATWVFYHDYVCNNINFPHRCKAIGAWTGTIWPVYWSTVYWRMHLNENSGRLLPGLPEPGDDGHRGGLYNGPGPDYEEEFNYRG